MRVLFIVAFTERIANREAENARLLVRFQRSLKPNFKRNRYNREKVVTSQSHFRCAIMFRGKGKVLKKMIYESFAYEENLN